MIQRIPPAIWLVTLLLATLLGIWPGVGIMQPHWVFFGALFGWLFVPLELYGLIAGFITHSSANTNDPASWFTLLAALGYPLAMLGYSACAYWVIRSTRSRRNGWWLMVVAVFVSTLASSRLPWRQ